MIFCIGITDQQRRYGPQPPPPGGENPVVSNLTSVDDGNHISFGYDYSSPIGAPESNITPIVDEVTFTASQYKNGIQISFTAQLINTSIYNPDSYTFKIYRANDIKGASLILINTVTQSSNVFQYTPTGSDVNKYLKVIASVTLDAGSNDVSEETNSVYTPIINA
jgi:hypothetical protein